MTVNDPVDKTPPQNIFSFRADCPADVDEFFAACDESGIAVMEPFRRELQAGFPDVAAQFHSTDQVTEEHLRQVAAGVVDLHVVVETLRDVSLAENSLERATPALQQDGDRGDLTPEQERWITDHMPTRRAPSRNYGMEL